MTEHAFSILNMGTVRDNEPRSGDLTAQARIRNAAIALFASEGFQRANVRDIAATAGVSAALVLHHFGSKAGLRQVCDDYVLQALVQRARSEATLAGVKDGVHDYLGNPSDFNLEVRYMARAIDEDSPAADQFVEAMVTESESVFAAGISDGSVRPTSDLRALAVLTVLNSMALLTMPPPIARALGQEALNPEVMARMARPSLELYTYGLYTDDTLLQTIQDALNDSTLNTTTEHGREQ